VSTTVTRTRTTTARETVPTHRAVPPSPVRRNPVPGLRRRALTGGATLFWTALVVVPIYWLVVTSLRSRSDFTSDSLLAIVLPSAAFALPITVMILVSFLRDVPRSLFEAMIVDGAGDWRMLWSLAVPLARPALMAVAVYDGLQVWNGFLFPLILTQSGDKAVLQVFLPGEEGGRAVAQLLAGEANFSGKLPVQIPIAPGGQPYTYLHAPLADRQSWLSNLDPTPAFPFGHGLSYTTFEIDELAVDRELVPVDGEFTVAARVPGSVERE
jgi:hypothetical protein